MWVREVAWPRRGAHYARQPGITPVPRTRAASRARPRHCSFVSYYYCISVIDLIISPVICLGEEELKSVVAAFDSKSNAGGGEGGGSRRCWGIGGVWAALRCMYNMGCRDATAISCPAFTWLCFYRAVRVATSCATGANTGSCVPCI